MSWSAVARRVVHPYLRVPGSLEHLRWHAPVRALCALAHENPAQADAVREVLRQRDRMGTISTARRDGATTPGIGQRDTALGSWCRQVHADAVVTPTLGVAAVRVELVGGAWRVAVDGDSRAAVELGDDLGGIYVIRGLRLGLPSVLRSFTPVRGRRRPTDDLLSPAPVEILAAIAAGRRLEVATTSVAWATAGAVLGHAVPDDLVDERYLAPVVYRGAR